MDVIRGHLHAPPWAAAAIAIGNFDGVHRGHRALIERTRELARAHQARAIALTFHPHPGAVLTTKAAPPMLTSLERRLELLADAGLDAVVVEPFTQELAGLSASAFVDSVLIGALGARAIIVGYDFSYGAGRIGTTETLRAHGNRAGIEVDVLPQVEVGGEIASSTRVRGYLREGDLAGAGRLLARPWDVDGVVIHGAKRGREIGVPTANIQPDTELLIAPGIYAVTLSVEGGPPLPAVASLGTNPTFVQQGGLVLEVHVLDWAGDLYDKRVRTTFVARLREERTYPSVDTLLVQIRQDIVDARAALMR